MKSQKFLLCFACLLLTFKVNAHSMPDSLIRWSWYIDLGGQGIHPSLNVDKILKPSRNIRFGFNVGINFPGVPTTKSTGINFSAFALVGKKTNYLEVGAGLGANYIISSNKVMYYEIYQTLSSTGQDSLVYHNFFSSERRSLTYGFIKLGYRFYNSRTNIICRVYVMPMYGIQNIQYGYKGAHFQNRIETRAHNAPYFTTRLGIWGGFSIGKYLVPKKYREARSSSH